MFFFPCSLSQGFSSLKPFVLLIFNGSEHNRFFWLLGDGSQVLDNGLLLAFDQRITVQFGQIEGLLCQDIFVLLGNGSGQLDPVRSDLLGLGLESRKFVFARVKPVISIAEMDHNGIFWSKARIVLQVRNDSIDLPVETGDCTAKSGNWLDFLSGGIVT